VREFWNQLLLAAHAGEPVYQPEELVPVHDDPIPVVLAVNLERRRHLSLLSGIGLAPLRRFWASSTYSSPFATSSPPSFEETRFGLFQ